MTFEAPKAYTYGWNGAVIDYQILGANKQEVDKIDVGLVHCTKGT